MNLPVDQEQAVPASEHENVTQLPPTVPARLAIDSSLSKPLIYSTWRAEPMHFFKNSTKDVKEINELRESKKSLEAEVAMLRQKLTYLTNQNKQLMQAKSKRPRIKRVEYNLIFDTRERFHVVESVDEVIRNGSD